MFKGSSAHIANRLHLVGKSLNDAQEAVRVKHLHGLRKRAQGCTATAKLSLHVLKFTGSLERPKGAKHGIEHEYQDEQAVLIIVQVAVASLITLAAVIVKMLKHRQEHFNVL